jgi:hypothetical protein
MFQLQPLILGENHILTETRCWLTTHLPRLKEMGYTHFGFEFDANVSLDDLIERIRQTIESGDLTQSMGVEQIIEAKKIRSLEWFFAKYGIEQGHAKTSEELLAILMKSYSHIYNKYIPEMEHGIGLDRSKAKSIMLHHEEKKVLLKLLLKLKELNFQYIGLDLNLGEARDGMAPGYMWDERNQSIVQAIVNTARLSKGGLITLNGIMHLSPIAEMLEDLYQTDPMFASKKEELGQYSFLRIFDKAAIEIAPTWMSDALAIQEVRLKKQRFSTRLKITQLEFTDTEATEIYLNSLGEVSFYDPTHISDQHTVKLLNEKCHTFFSALKWRDNELVDAVTKHPDAIKKPDVQHQLRQAGVFFYFNDGKLIVPGVNTTTVADAIKDMRPK